MNIVNPSEPKKLSVQRDGDDELWTVEGKLDDGFQFRMPIITKPHRTTSEPVERWHYVHGSDYTWSPRQYEELAVIMDRHDCTPRCETGWWFSQAVLDTFASKAPGITPEFYIRWPGYDTPSFSGEIGTLDIPEEPGFSTDELKFLKHLQRMTGTQTWEALKFLWLAFRKQSMLWLAKERRPLDFGFIRITPMPYRVNWKEALAVRFGGILKCFRKGNHGQRHDILQESGFFDALSSVKLLAVDKDKVFCHWTLEATPSADMDQTMNEYEYAKFRRIGPAGYARWILRCMADRLSETLRIFSRYVQTVSLPPGRRVGSESAFGVEIIAPELRDKRIRPGKGIVEALDLSPEQFSRLTDTSDHAETRSETLKLPEFVRTVHPFKELPEKIEMNGFE